MCQSFKIVNVGLLLWLERNKRLQDVHFALLYVSKVWIKALNTSYLQEHFLSSKCFLFFFNNNKNIY